MTAKPEPKRPRVNVTLSPEMWVLLGDLATIAGKPRAAIVSDMLDTVAPLMMSQAEAHLRLKEVTSPEAAKQVLHDQWAKEQARVNQALLDLDTDGRTVKGKRAKRGAGGRASP